MARYVPVDLRRSKYRILGLIGQGQFGRVFCASHRKTGRLVALKNLEHQRFPTHQFLRELRFLLSLQHPNIVTCQALEHTQTGRYLVMDYCEGGTLRSLMEREGWLNLRQGLQLISNILAGLAHAHDRGIVHCDIKPENILLTVQPQGWIARVSDFGIARLSQELELSSGATGSPAYMSPERFYGQYSPTSDLYAVGIMLFEMLVGRRPFSGVPGDLMAAHLNQPVHIPDEVPISLRPIITKALQKLSARRFATAREMLAEIESLLTSQTWLKDFNLQSQSLPLLSEEEAAPVVAFTSHHQTDLAAPIAQLLHWPKPTASQGSSSTNSQACWLGQVVELPTGRQLEIQEQCDLGAADLGKAQLVLTVPLPNQIHHLLVCQQYCFAIGDRAIYGLPTFSSDSSANLSSTGLPEPTASLSMVPLLQLSTDLIADIAPNGAWIGTVNKLATPNANPTQVKIWKVPKTVFNQPPTDHSSTRKPSSDRPEAPEFLAQVVATATSQASQLKQVIIPDLRHLVIVSEVPGYTAQQLLTEPDSSLSSEGLTSSSKLEVFSRRGKPLGQWVLPIRLGHLVKTYRPYRLVTIEPLNPQSILLLDLKPFRMLRIQLNFQPQQIIPMPWGYVLASAQGQLLCLDETGQSIGRIEPPPEMLTEPNTQITAVTAYSKTGLALTTWSPLKQQGLLHLLDLSQLDLDMVF